MNKLKFDNDPNIPDIIELKSVTQRYPDIEKPVIDELDFLIENNPGENQFITILGASGCGKSTILRYIAGLQTPTSGEVLLYGKPITKETVVGMVFQKYSSFPWLTVLDNVALGLEFQNISKKERLEKAMEMLELVGLQDHYKKYAQYPILSGGQLQRVAIARSFLANPKILLMDEPFGALDIQTRMKMQELLRMTLEKFKDMAILFVTHDIYEAVYLSDEIYFMQANPGEIVEKVDIKFNSKRSKEIKREKQFLAKVYEVEDKLEKIATESLKNAKK